VALAVLLLAGGVVEGASLKLCKQTCGPSIQSGCAGLRKGKLRKCKKRILRACKRGTIACTVVTTTAPSAPPTTVTTSLPTTTTTTIPAALLSFIGTWNLTAELTGGNCPDLPSGTTHDTADIRADASGAKASLETVPGIFTGGIDAQDDLRLSAEVAEPTPGCVSVVELRLEGPVQASTESTPGDASVTRICSGTRQCQTTYSCVWQRAGTGP
jgi:hypothetical protein